MAVDRSTATRHWGVLALNTVGSVITVLSLFVWLTGYSRDDALGALGSPFVLWGLVALFAVSAWAGFASARQSRQSTDAEIAQLKTEHAAELDKLQSEHEDAEESLRTSHERQVAEARAEGVNATAQRQREARADVRLVPSLLGDLAEGGETRESVENHPGEKVFRRAWATAVDSALERWGTNTSTIYDQALREAVEEAMRALDAFGRSLIDYETFAWEEDGPFFDMRLRRFSTEKEYRAFLREQPRLRADVRDALRAVEARLYTLGVEAGDD